jgi:Ca-activated chloride channel family protein
MGELKIPGCSTARPRWRITPPKSSERSFIMRRKLLRSYLASLLILAFAASLLPTITANAGQSTQRARRGKNGSVTDKAESNPLAKNPQPSAPGEVDDSEASPDGKAADNVTQSHSGLALQSEKSATTNDSRNAQQSRPPQSSNKKPEPPPFDRPAMNPDAGASSSSERSASPPANSGSPPDASSRPVPSRSTNAPPSSTSRSSGPPVLHRPSPTDSRTGSSRQTSPERQGDDSVFSNDPNNSSGRNRDQRPVLRRPSDPQEEDRAPGSQRQSGDRDNSQQSSRPADGGDDQVIKLESTLVNIPLLVSDRSGRYIPRLSKNDFVLYEDGVQQEIASFGSEEVPFNVALLLDVSPSVEGNIESIQDAALAFVRQLRPQDRVLVASFDRGINYLTDFTNNRQELEWAIRRVRTGSGTSVYDAVYDTVARRLRGIEGRKAMILFSDGEDTTSRRASYDDAINIVTESDVLVYGLRYPGAGGGGGGYSPPWSRNPFPRSPWPGIQLPLPIPWPRSRRNGPYGGGGNHRTWGGKDFMKDITEAGGGPVFDAERVSDMSGLASRIADELRHVYVISYYPKNALSNGGYRAIRIRVKARDDIAVRHRRGYNARDVNSPSHND